MNLLDYIKDDKLTIIVKANAPKNKLIAYDESKSVLQIEIKAKAENNKANTEIIKFVTKLSNKHAKIISGRNSRKKILKFT